MIIIACASANCGSVEFRDRIRVSDDLEIIKLSEHSYVHISYAELPGFGRFGSNGYIYTNNGEALLFDTPVNDVLTKRLTGWMTAALRVRIVGFVPNHWHDDCMGGLRHIHALNIPSYANERTIAIAKKKNLPVPQHGFRDSLTLKAGSGSVVCRYYGPAHSDDNIVAWAPSEKVLFAGCMVKDLASKSPGNLSDANISEWPRTIDRLISGYPGAKTVIPGHGKFGGIDLLTHTKEVIGSYGNRH
jgi:metallo-beta-lactamase class B